MVIDLGNSGWGPTGNRGRAEGPLRSSPRPEISVIVPVTENPRALDELYREFSQVFADHGETAEFVFVAEPWADRFLDPIRSLAMQGEPVRIIETGERAGESNLLLAAHPHCRGKVIVTLPPYRRIAPPEIMKLIDRVRRGGVALASAARRYDDTEHWINRLQRRAFHWFLKAMVGHPFKDIASGVRAMRPQVLREVPIYGDTFRFLPLLASREGFPVEEVETDRDTKDDGIKVYSAGIYVRRLVDLFGIGFLIRFTYKPLRFFGLMGSASALFGGLILLVMSVQRLWGTPVADRPVLVFGVLLVVIGVQAIALGLIGELIVHFSVAPRRGYRVRRTRTQQFPGRMRGGPPPSSTGIPPEPATSRP